MFVAVIFQELGISCVELELSLLRLDGTTDQPLNWACAGRCPPWWPFDNRGLKFITPGQNDRYHTFWQSPFPPTPLHVPHTLHVPLPVPLKPYASAQPPSLSPKYPTPLAFSWETGLRFVSLFALPKASAFWFTVLQARWTWFHNNPVQIIISECNLWQLLELLLCIHPGFCSLLSSLSTLLLSFCSSIGPIFWFSAFLSSNYWDALAMF